MILRAGVLSYIPSIFYSFSWVIDLYAVSQRDHAWIKSLSDRLVTKINAQVEHVVRNGDTSGYPGCVNLSFAYVEGESLLMALKVRAVASYLLIETNRHPRTSPFLREVRVHQRHWSHRTFSVL